MNAQEIYKLWHSETFKAKGKNVRAVKNFEKAMAKESWKYFESFEHFLERNNGSIDVDIYMKSLATFYEGWFNPMLLGSQKSIRIYKDYVAEHVENVNNIENAKEEVVRSLKFVIKFCKERAIGGLGEYISHDMYLIPSILKHYNSGSISPFFLASIDNFNIILSNYPSDVIKDYIPDFKNWYSTYRVKIITNPETKRISQNLSKIIEKYLKSDK